MPEPLCTGLVTDHARIGEPRAPIRRPQSGDSDQQLRAVKIGAIANRASL